MSNKKNDQKTHQKTQLMNRRKFLASASLLLGSVGVAPLIRSELLQKIGRELLPSANAAEGGQQVDFMIELCGRAGVPNLWLGTGSAFTQTGGSQYPNAGIQLVSDLRMVSGGGATGLYMNNVNGGGNSVAGLLGPHASNIAVSQGFSADGLGHTPLFAQREGAKGMGLTTPIIEFADRAKRNFSYQNLIVHGVNWMRNDVTNQTNGLQDLVDVGSAADFQNLFKEPVLRLNKTEVGFVAEASKALSQIQASRLKNRINNIENVQKSHEKGTELLVQDFSQMLSITGMSANFKAGQPNFNGNNWGDVGSAMAYTCKAFEHGLIATSTITYRSGDWHGNQQPGPASRQAQAALHFSSILSATIAYLKATPHPFRAGETLWDRTLIQMSSEFTRGVSFMGQDNNDGGTTGFVLMGGRVNGGYYGGFDLPASQGGRAYGFDPASGASTSGMKNKTGQLYNTVNAWLGNTTKVAGDGTLACLMKA